MTEPLVCPRCPQCGCPRFECVRPTGWVAFVSNRKCTACQTTYTPPTPGWAAGVFVAIGVVLVAGCGASLYLGWKQGRPAAIPLNAVLALLGILSMRYGFASRRCAAAVPPEWPEVIPVVTLGGQVRPWLREHVWQLAACAWVGIVVLAAVTWAGRTREHHKQTRREQLRAMYALEKVGATHNGSSSDEGVIPNPTVVTFQHSPYTTTEWPEFVDADLQLATIFPKLDSFTVESTRVTDAGLVHLEHTAGSSV